jgi:RNA polymerase subunit RPABC4/transcription elongation factor Spt4
LEEIFVASTESSAELKALLAELKHRKVPKAIALADKVKKSLDCLVGSKTGKQNADLPNQPPPTTEPAHKIIECQKCHRRLRIELISEERQQSCPACNAEFTTAYRDGVLSIVFESTEPAAHDQQLRLTLLDAYQLFKADPSTPWEDIEFARRKLIQQYHPDKVAALGQKLREVAEVEGKRINIAFDMLRKERGL